MSRIYFGPHLGEIDRSDAIRVVNIGIALPTDDDQNTYLHLRDSSDLDCPIYRLSPTMLITLAAQVLDALAALDLPTEKINNTIGLIRKAAAEPYVIKLNPS